jgi:hypothetical protein
MCHICHIWLVPLTLVKSGRTPGTHGVRLRSLSSSAPSAPSPSLIVTKHPHPLYLFQKTNGNNHNNHPRSHVHCSLESGCESGMSSEIGDGVRRQEKIGRERKEGSTKKSERERSAEIVWTEVQLDSPRAEKSTQIKGENFSQDFLIREHGRNGALLGEQEGGL